MTEDAIHSSGGWTQTRTVEGMTMAVPWLCRKKAAEGGCENNDERMKYV